MKTPPLLLGAALLFWGWEAGVPWAGAVLGLVLESSRLARRDWNPGLKEFSRVSDLCAVLLAALAGYFYLTQPAVYALRSLVKFLPLPLFPLILAQALSARGAVDAGALLMSLRRSANPAAPGPFVEVSRPFLVVCLLGAGAANVPGPVFYLGMTALFAWLFWAARPSYSRAYVCGPLLILAAMLGYAGQAGLHNLQILLENKVPRLLSGLDAQGADPYSSRTAIGRLGEIKQSGSIVLRVKKTGPGGVPALLREATYNTYRSGEWRAKEAPFSPAAPSPGNVWTVAAGAGPEKFSVYAAFERGRGVLALPGGARAVSDLPAEDVGMNTLGAVRVDGAPPRVVYEVAWDPSGAASRDSPPGPADLALPAGEAALLRRVAGQLGLGRLPPGKALAKLHDYFAGDFRYSLYRKEPAQKGGSPLEVFLMRTRAGHCEYFGTATALLLRAAGIPARYATGYSVQEYSRLQKAYLVRQRHAHAWALAWVNGAWTEADNTPSTWLEEESAGARPDEPLRDAFAWLAYQFFTLRPGLPSGLARPLAWLGALLAGLALWKGFARFYRRSASPVTAGPAHRQGLDSEFYAVERELAGEGAGRRRGETLRAWTLRLDDGTADMAELKRLAGLHARLRFDPAGVMPGEREALRAGARAWLRRRKGGRR